MIAHVDGEVASIGADWVVIDVGGVGYRINAGPPVIALARPGERLRLHTHQVVREDLQALYGFRSAEELGFFELLITVTGVGPKAGMAIVASRPVPDLQLAIFQGDEAMLTAVSGVGKRLAGRIVLELREKVAAAAAGVGPAADREGAHPAGESEVMAALQALGYSTGEAREAARGAVAALPPGSGLEDRVRAALRALRRD